MTTLKCPAGNFFVLIQFEDPVLIEFKTKVCHKSLSVLELIGLLIVSG